jgi:glycosyltransferase involved in cell wall biosynthesis
MVDSALLFHGLTASLGSAPHWLTMNPRNPEPVIYPEVPLKEFGLWELAESCAVAIPNCAPLVSDEFSPDPNVLFQFLATHCPSALYLHYYVPFWYPMMVACRRLGAPFGLHVQVFYHRGDRSRPQLPFHFERDSQAVTAVKDADFLTVSQQDDASLLSEHMHVDPSRIHVLPKGVPRETWLEAATQSDREALRSRMPEVRADLPVFLYVGRFEETKNITWFLTNVMPLLDDQADEFHLLLIGWGSQINVVKRLAGRLGNVTAIEDRLDYRSALRLVADSDVVLFPSGYDFAPRLPLEAILLRRHLILGDFNFNSVYRGYATMVRPQREENATLEYSGELVTYGVPDAVEMANACRSAIGYWRHAVLPSSSKFSTSERLDNGRTAAEVVLSAFRF